MKLNTKFKSSNLLNLLISLPLRGNLKAIVMTPYDYIGSLGSDFLRNCLSYNN
jgi:hypothetical protein